MLPRGYEYIKQTTERIININHLFICLYSLYSL